MNQRQVQALQNRSLIRHLGFGLIGMLAVTTLFIEGLFDNPWTSWFLPFEPNVLAREKLVLLLYAPALLFLVLPRVRWVRDLLILSSVACITMSGMDFIVRLTGLAENRMVPIRLPQLPAFRRWAPNLHVSGTSWGDLADMAGDPSLRQLRHVDFRTDELGFRNNHSGKDIDLLLVGDSFGAGLGADQDSTPAARLERATGLRTYSLAFPGSPHDEYIDLLMESPHLTFHPHAELVWILFTGNDLFDRSEQFGEPDVLPWRTGLSAWKVSYRNYRERSPIRQLIIGVYHRIFGTERPETPIARPLAGGPPLLFRGRYQDAVNLSRNQVEHLPNFTSIRHTLGEMRALVERLHLDLRIVIVPAKGEVYRWILEGRRRQPSDTTSSGFAQALLGACTETHLHCVDAMAPIVRAAYQRFDVAGDLVYWRDDTHLDDEGYGILSEVIRRDLQSGSQKPLVP